jgi:hypothetical protein
MSRTRSQEIPATRPAHPWERDRLRAFARWEAEVRRTPYGRPLPDVAGFVDAIEPPLEWSHAAETRRLFALSALPMHPSPTYLAAVPSGRRPPAGGTLVRLARPVKRVLPSPNTAYGELLIEVRDGVGRASWEEILEGVSPQVAREVVPQLSELWHLPAQATEALLLPIVGSIPWHGRPAGLDLFLEVEGWSLARYRGFLSGLLYLVPAWVGGTRRRFTTLDRELVLASGVKIRRQAAVSDRPFEIQVRTVSRAPSARPADGALSRSTITYGSALITEFVAALAAGQMAVLLTSAETSRVPRAEVEIPESLRAAVWGLHWWTPEPPDSPDWHRWLRSEEPRLRESLEAIPIPSSTFPSNPGTSIPSGREFRERFVQTAVARARLRGAPEVEEADLVWAVDSFIRAIQRAAEWAEKGRGPLARSLDRTEGRRTSRLRGTLQNLLGENPRGLTLQEVLETLRVSHIIASPWEVENQLELLRIRGLLFQEPSGRYRLA